jgi:hypothetical protein
MGYSTYRAIPSVIEQVVKTLSSGVLASGFVQCLGADNSRLKKIAEVRLLLVFDGFIDPLPALMSGMWIIEAAPPTALKIGQTVGAMIDPRRFAFDPGVLSAIPAT